MASPATETWWSTFLDAHGRDSEEEAAFDGFLSTNGIPAGAGPDELQQAYTHFVQFMAESERREADRGPARAELAAHEAVRELEHHFVAKSRVSAPGVEKPLVAATRPAESRKPLAESGVGPSGEAQLVPAQGEGTAPPRHGVASQGTAGTTPPESPPVSPPHPAPTSAHESESRETRGGRPRSSSGES